MISVTNVRDFYANVREFYLNILRRWLKLAELSFSPLRLIVNMLALYIKGIEEVLWYICISETTHNPWVLCIYGKQAYCSPASVRKSLLLLKLIVNMLALYIKAIEEVLLYLRALVTWGKFKKKMF